MSVNESRGAALPGASACNRAGETWAQLEMGPGLGWPVGDADDRYTSMELGKSIVEDLATFITGRGLKTVSSYLPEGARALSRWRAVGWSAGEMSLSAELPSADMPGAFVISAKAEI